MSFIQSMSHRVLAFTFFIGIGAAAHAVVNQPLTQYTDFNSFAAATGPLQTESFNSFFADQAANNLNFGAFVGHNSLQIDAPDLNYSIDGTTNVYADLSYGGWFDLRFNAPVMAFGARFSGLSSRIRLGIDADSLAGYGSYYHLGSYQATASIDNTPQFIGFTSTQAFNRITFVSDGCCSARFALDNVVHTSALAPVTPAVPEPETYAMLLAGLGMLGAVARQRTKNG
jgi:PEP-CTERM motif